MRCLVLPAPLSLPALCVYVSSHLLCIKARTDLNWLEVTCFVYKWVLLGCHSPRTLGGCNTVNHAACVYIPGKKPQGFLCHSFV